MIDITHEQTISLTQAAAMLPTGRRGRPVHLSCVMRWILSGASAPDGRRVRLDAIRIGGRWITSREALQRFAEALTPDVMVSPISTPRTPTRRQRASERAARQLEDLGI